MKINLILIVSDCIFPEQRTVTPLAAAAVPQMLLVCIEGWRYREAGGSQKKLPL